MFNGSSSFLNYSADGNISATDLPLAYSPKSPSVEAKQAVLRPKSLAERARLNAGLVFRFFWLIWNIKF